MKIRFLPILGVIAIALSAMVLAFWPSKQVPARQTESNLTANRGVTGVSPSEGVVEPHLPAPVVAPAGMPVSLPAPVAPLPPDEPSPTQHLAFRQLQTLLARKQAGATGQGGESDRITRQLRDEARRAGLEPWRMMPPNASPEFAFRPEPTDGAERMLTADNQRHGLTATFGNDGLRVQAAAQQPEPASAVGLAPVVPGFNDWEFNLRLAGINENAGAARANREADIPTANRLESHHGPLTEWYVNDAQGIEHGFTVHTRPEVRGDVSAELRVQLEMATSLVAQLDESARSIDFYSLSGEPVLSYGGLLAYDATGRDLPARFELDVGRLGIVVDDRDATYPVVIDPLLTSTMVRDLNTVPNSSQPNWLVEFQGKLFFSANDGVNGVRLWKSDGTVAGTVRVGDSSQYPVYLTVAGNTLYFSAFDNSAGYELWKSDGTAAGTIVVKDIYPGRSYSSSPSFLTPVGNGVYFWAYDGVNGQELWKSDGTAAGTVLVKDLNPGAGSSSPSSSTAVKSVGNILFFSLSSWDTSPGTELWRSDGTANGTFLVRDIYPGSYYVSYYGADYPNSSAPDYFAELNGTLFFSANDGVNGARLWKSDGTAAGTVRVSDSSQYTSYLAVAGNTLYFSAYGSYAGYELWKSDGTAAGTIVVKDIYPGGASSYPSCITPAGNGVYFWANDGVNGQELWKSDGTGAGTMLVRDLNPGSGSSVPGNNNLGVEAVGSTLFFNFQNVSPTSVWSVPPEGMELWKSDGTSGGTQLVTDLFSGNQGANPGYLVEFKGVLYFSATDGVNSQCLWKSDGTAAGTVRVGDSALYPFNLTVAGNFLYFNAYGHSTGYELWKSDGTAAGTVVVKDIYPGNANSFPSYITPAGNGVYFWATDSLNGAELWKSDGTAAGTLLVKDLNPGNSGSSPYGGRLLVSGSILFFVYSDAAGDELWRSDGTSAGTYRLRDIYPGPSGSYPFNLVEFNAQLYFSAADGVNGNRLWKSDGTTAGTVRIGDSSESPWNLTVAGNTLYFSAHSYGASVELWRSDGSAGGTAMVKDINPGWGGSGPQNLKAIGSTLYFTANAGPHGYELWRSDGTEAGTRLVKDIATGTPNSFPNYLTAAGNRLYFVADDGQTGRELWTSDGTEGGTVQVIDFSPGVGNGSYRTLASAGGTMFFTSSDPQYGWELHRVIQANAPPSPAPDAFSVAEDGTLTVTAGGILANDTDADGGRTLDRDGDGVADYLDSNASNAGVSQNIGYNGLVATLEPGSTPAHGSVVVNPDGSFSYQPSPDFSGADSFQYRAADGIDASAVATVALTVTPVNDVPAARALTIVTPEDTQVGITLQGTDVDPGDTANLTFTVANGPAYGALSGTPPLLTYTPGSNFSGTDSFTYVAHDGALDSTPATVTLAVTSEADPPVATAQAVSVAEDSSVTISLSGTDPDGDQLSFALTGNPSHGTLAGAPPNLTYTPAPDFNGSDSFTFKVGDGLFESPSVSVAVTVTPVNDTPTVEGLSVTTSENTPVLLALQSSDLDGDNLEFVVVESAGHGLVSGQAPNLSYIPNFGFNGADSMTFKVNDGTEDSAVASVAITVTPVNDPPEANPMALTTSEDVPLPVTLNGFDTEESGFAQLRIMSGAGGQRPAGRLLFGGDGRLYGTANSGGSSSYGTVFGLNADGSGYTVVHDFTGSTSDGRYPYGGVVEDANGVLYGTTRGGGMSGQGTVFKVGRDGSGFQVIHHFYFDYAGDGASPESELLLGSDGVLYGTAYEGGQNSAGTLFRLDRSGSNFAVLHAFGAGTTDGRYSTAGVIEGGDGFLYGTTRFSGSAVGIGGTVYRIRPNGSDYQVLHSFPANGTEGRQLLSSVVLGPEGMLYGTAWQGGDSDSGLIYRLNPDGSSFAVVRRFGGLGDGTRPYAEIIRGSDDWLYGVTSQDGVLGGGAVFRMGAGGTDYQILWRFSSAGPSGRILDSAVTEGPDGALYGMTSLGGASDTGTIFRLPKEPATLQFTMVAGPNQGTLGGTPPNLLYTPRANFNGSDLFTFRANDGSVDSLAVRTIFITVAAVNDAPVSGDQTLTTAEDTALTVTLTGTDAENSALTYSVVTAPSHGVLTGTAPNVTYTPGVDYNGPDSFTFKANDGTEDSAPASVVINVSPVNDRPLAVNAIPDQSAQYGSPFDSTFAADTFVDVDPGQTLSYSAADLPPGITFDGVTRTFSGTPSAAGSFTLTVMAVDDGSPVLSASTTFSLNITQAPQTISFAAMSDRTYGDSPFALSATSSSGLPVNFASLTPSVATVTGNTVTVVGAGTATIRASQAGDANHLAAGDVDQTFMVDKATPVITWANQADINCRTPLGAVQLRATANVPGAFTYNPPAGTTLGLGDAQLLTASFTPADAVNYNSASGTTAINVRLDAGGLPGELDLSFDPGTDWVSYQVRMVAAQTDGKVLVCGWFTSVNGVSRNEIARLNADGSLDLSFDPGSGAVGGGIDAVAVQADGRVLICGDFTSINGVSRGGVARLNQDGSVDSGFNPGTGANSRVHTVAVQTDGKVLLGGLFTAVNGVSRNRIARLNNDGSVDTGFDPGSGPDDNYVYRLALQPDGKTLIVGPFTSVNGVSRNRIARLNGDGSLDSSFDVGSGANQDVNSVALQSDGKVLIGGTFTTVNGLSRSRLARLEVDGSVDLGFSPGVAGPVFSVAVQTDGKVLIGGNMGSVNGVSRIGVARIHPNGTVDLDFDSGSGPDNLVRSMAFQPDGKVLVVGDFTSINGVARARIARLEGGPLDPAIILNGSASMTVDYGTPFTDPGATAADGCGNVLAVTVDGTVNTLVPDTYTLTYTAVDDAGQIASAARTVTVIVTDQPPVAAAGADQVLYAGADCVATLQLDGSASSDPDGDALTHSWVVYTQTPSGLVASAPALGAITTWTVSAGTYEAELTVSTTVDGPTLTATDRATITVLPSAPTVTALDPVSVYAGDAGFTLTVNGGCFQEGAIVYWNGSPRPTTVVGGAQLTALISAGDLNTTEYITTTLVTVMNGDGQVSNPLGFSIVAQSVGTVDTSVVTPGASTTVSTAPATAGDSGVAVAVQNNGGEPISVVAATYDTKPVGDTAFQIGNGNYVDVQINGADAQDLAGVNFYYPSTVTGSPENQLKLRYFDGVNWIPVLSSGGLPPAKDTTDNLDGTISGGRFTTIFDATSTPTITQLGGTVFGMFESLPQIDAVNGPANPLPLGNPVTLSVDFVALGQQNALAVSFLWDDGTETDVIPQATGSASAAHLYTAPGVYGVTVQVVDGEGDRRESRFEYVVIYDPSGGFVTGGGWIDSPVGAYVFDPTLTGKANFGFVSKYKKGANVPTGNTEFQFKAGDLKFSSTVYLWLVVAGTKAQYKGDGTINGTGSYGFLLTATDGDAKSGGDGLDKFRIKIWDKASGAIVYDNAHGSSDDIDSANPQAIGGGSIVIQKSR